MKVTYLNVTAVNGIEIYASGPLPCPPLTENCRAAQFNLCRKLHSLKEAVFSAVDVKRAFRRKRIM